MGVFVHASKVVFGLYGRKQRRNIVSEVVFISFLPRDTADRCIGLERISQGRARDIRLGIRELIIECIRKLSNIV